MLAFSGEFKVWKIKMSNFQTVWRQYLADLLVHSDMQSSLALSSALNEGGRGIFWQQSIRVIWKSEQTETQSVTHLDLFWIEMTKLRSWWSLSSESDRDQHLFQGLVILTRNDSWALFRDVQCISGNVCTSTTASFGNFLKQQLIPHSYRSVLVRKMSQKDIFVGWKEEKLTSAIFVLRHCRTQIVLNYWNMSYHNRIFFKKIEERQTNSNNSLVISLAFINKYHFTTYMFL